MARNRRPNRIAAHTAPSPLFVCGGALIVAFLFQDNLYARLAWAVVFGGLAVLAGKRLRWGYFAIMIGSITFFNLLTPVGRVMAELGPLVVTEGALTQGLTKGVGIVGLVFISLFSVSPDLKLPGTLGGLLGRVFFYFERILEGKKQVRARHLVDSLDTILLERFPLDTDDVGSAAAERPRSARHTTTVGWIGLTVVTVAAWGTTILV